MSSDLITAVDEITGRTAHAFLSDDRTDPDIAVECFVLTPQDGLPSMAAERS